MVMQGGKEMITTDKWGLWFRAKEPLQLTLVLRGIKGIQVLFVCFYGAS